MWANGIRVDKHHRDGVDNKVPILYCMFLILLEFYADLQLLSF